MPRAILRSVVALAFTAVTANAADLASRSRIGDIFAEPAAPRSDLDRRNLAPGPVIPYTELPNPVWARGGYNYGSAFSYASGPYYGGGGVTYIFRLPYACKFYGYC
jgi:hypothetical protein